MSEINLKDIWQSQTINPDINANEFILKAKKFQQKNRTKNILLNVLLGATALFISGLVLYYQPKMIITKIGTLLVLIAIVMQIIVSTKLFSKNTNNLSSSSDYLHELLEFQKKLVFSQTTIMSLYFILLSIGIFLYMIEYAMRMSTIGMLITYGITTLWIAINWFILRPRIIKKQQEKLNEIIADLENINKQFEDEI
ncbi:hypothetical protein [Flavobacterium sp.]|uniref:hypothetical protein n=1 Tax=Flavobacterium sp. TaxID=239 RepID=UPI00374DE5BD